MKPYTVIVALLLCLSLCACAGHSAPNPTAQIANPWRDWETLSEAEAAVGFSLGIPTELGGFRATVFRTLEQELLEVIYEDGDRQVCVRKSPQEQQDISGDYTQYDRREEQQQGDAQLILYGDETHTGKILIYRPGFSWALLSPDGYPGDSGEDFIRAVLAAA